MSQHFRLSPHIKGEGLMIGSNARAAYGAAMMERNA